MFWLPVWCCRTPGQTSSSLHCWADLAPGGRQLPVGSLRVQLHLRPASFQMSSPCPAHCRTTLGIHRAVVQFCELMKAQSQLRHSTAAVSKRCVKGSSTTHCMYQDSQLSTGKAPYPLTRCHGCQYKLSYNILLTILLWQAC